MNLITSDHLNIHYHDAGQGEPVILLHCSSASHKEWQFLFDKLQANYRVLAPDLVGYGKSDHWSASKPYDVMTDIRVIEQLMVIAEQPCHIIGHSYGGEMGLEAARLNSANVSSVCVVEPVAFHLLKGSEFHNEWLRITGIGDQVTEQMRAGNVSKAAGIYMSYWIGSVKWLFMPRRMKQRIIDSMDKVVQEFSTIRPALTRLEEYELNDWPITLVEGDRTRDTAKGIVELLSRAMRDAHRIVIPGAGHMSPFTHRERVGEIILQHLARVNELPA